MEHNGIEDVDISSLYHTKRESTQPDLSYHLIVWGIKATALLMTSPSTSIAMVVISSTQSKDRIIPKKYWGLGLIEN